MESFGDQHLLFHARYKYLKLPKSNTNDHGIFTGYVNRKYEKIHLQSFTENQCLIFFSLAFNHHTTLWYAHGYYIDWKRIKDFTVKLF